MGPYDGGGSESLDGIAGWIGTGDLVLVYLINQIKDTGIIVLLRLV